MPQYPDGTLIHQAEEWNRLTGSIPADYTIFFKDGIYYAESLIPGKPDYDSSAPGVTKAIVQQDAVDALATGGTIYLKEITLDETVTYGNTILIIEDYQGARKIYSKQGKHLACPLLTADPSTTGWGASQKGFWWFNTTANVYKYWDGSGIQTLDTSGAPPPGGTYILEPKYTVFKFGATYYAMDEDGTIDYSSADACAVINAAVGAMSEGQIIVIKCDFTVTTSILITKRIHYSHFGKALLTTNIPYLIIGDLTHIVMKGLYVYVSEICGPGKAIGGQGIHLVNCAQNTFSIGWLHECQVGIFFSKSGGSSIYLSDNKFTFDTLEECEKAIFFEGAATIGASPIMQGNEFHGNIWGSDYGINIEANTNSGFGYFEGVIDNLTCPGSKDFYNLGVTNEGWVIIAKYIRTLTIFSTFNSNDKLVTPGTVGSTWNPPSYTIWRKGDTYLAVTPNGQIPYSGTVAPTVIQAVINVMPVRSTIIIECDIDIYTTIQINKVINYIHNGKASFTGAVNYLTIGDATHSVAKGLYVYVKEIFGTTKEGHAIHLVNCAQNTFVIGWIRYCGAGIFFSKEAGATAYLSDNKFTFDNIEACTKAVFFEGATSLPVAPVMEGNEFHGNVFGNDMGIETEVNTKSGYGYFEGTIDNADVPASKDFYNLSSENKGWLIFPKYIRIAACQLNTNDHLVSPRDIFGTQVQVDHQFVRGAGTRINGVTGTSYVAMEATNLCWRPENWQNQNIKAIYIFLNGYVGTNTGTIGIRVWNDTDSVEVAKAEKTGGATGWIDVQVDVTTIIKAYTLYKTLQVQTIGDGTNYVEVDNVLLQIVNYV